MPPRPWRLRPRRRRLIRARCSRRAEVAHQHVRRGLLVTLDGQLQTVIQEAQVEAEVVARHNLPLQVGQSDVIGLHGHHVYVSVFRTILRGVEVVLSGLVTYAAPAGTHGEHGQPLAGGLHPRLVADDPLQ